MDGLALGKDGRTGLANGLFVGEIQRWETVVGSDPVGVLFLREEEWHAGEFQCLSEPVQSPLGDFEFLHQALWIPLARSADELEELQQPSQTEVVPEPSLGLGWPVVLG